MIEQVDVSTGTKSVPVDFIIFISKIFYRTNPKQCHTLTLFSSCPPISLSLSPSPRGVLAVNVRLCVRACVRACVRVCIIICVRAYECICVCVRVCVRSCVRACVRVCIIICVRACVCV